MPSPGNTSSLITSNTGAPQGTVLAPFLFTLYTSDCKSTELSCPLIKFADDTIMIGLITNDNCTSYEKELKCFVDYCDSNHLELNVSKTKEMIIDFRIKHADYEPIIIKGSKVERVQSYKYLGVLMDNKLDWHLHIDSVVKKLHKRMYCLRKLKSFDVSPKILTMFYNSVVCSVWRYCLVCWGGNATGAWDKLRIDNLICNAGRIAGELLQSVESLYNHEVAVTLKKIMKDESHILHKVFENCTMSRTGRMRLPFAATNRHPSSFVVRAMKHFNANVFKR